MAKMSKSCGYGTKEKGSKKHEMSEMKKMQIAKKKPAIKKKK